MESTIAKKIQLLNYEQDKYPMINKFMISLSDELLTYEEMEAIVNYLASKGIALTKPSQQSVLLNGLDFIKMQVEKMESLGCLGAYVEDPARINVKSAAQRIEYLNSIGEPVVTAEGKFVKALFSKRAFENKYGINYANPVQSVEPVQDIAVITPIVEESVTSWIEPAPIVEEPIIEAPTTEVYEEAYIPNEEMEPQFSDPIDEILSKPQTIGLNDETFERYEKLAESIRHVMVSVYGIEEINNSITDNLVKLVTNEIMDDSMVMFKAITYGKNITDEEVKRLRNTISEELEYTSILELDMGMAA